MNAPERIWYHGACHVTYTETADEKRRLPGTAEYVRSDLYETLAKRLEEAEAVIRPFAEAVERLSENIPEDRFADTSLATIKVGNLRAARRWMEGK